MPDFIGDAWDPSNVPPTKHGKFPEGVEPEDGTNVLIHWIINHHNCRTDRTDTILAIKDYLKTKDVESLVAVGMCWGAKVAFRAANLLDAVAACHGSMLDKTDAEATNVPMCLLNSKDEPEAYTAEIKPIMEAKPFADKCVFKTFPSMHHGWMGTRGIGANNDFTQDELAKQYRQAIEDLVSFFRKALA